MFTATNILLLLIFIGIIWVAILLSSYLTNVSHNLVVIANKLSEKSASDQLWDLIYDIKEDVKVIKSDADSIEKNTREIEHLLRFNNYPK